MKAANFRQPHQPTYKTRRFKLGKVASSIFVILIIFLWAYSGKWYILSRHLADHDKQNLPSTRLRLAQIHRHNIKGPANRWHQLLEIDDDYRFMADSFYQSAAQTNSQDWSQDPRFYTDKPFQYMFELKTQRQLIARSKLRHSQQSSPISYKIPSELSDEWYVDDVLVPDIGDKDTVISLALMSSNAYVGIPQTGDWRNISSPWNETESIHYGWEGDGLRGHVFTNEDESIVVITIKGTSAHGLPGSGDDETTDNDKRNDNLLFSCCCARISYLWTTVCDCYMKSYTCNERCLESNMRSNETYYSAVIDIFESVQERFHNATIWTTGHSLGGGLAALLGRTYGLPTVTFESPGEMLASQRLHLPSPPGIPSHLEAIWHFGHTADPIFMGTCNGASSTCSIAGYAMETGCHTGRICVYDVVSDYGWRVSMWNHKIHLVIDKVLTQYDGVAQCVIPEECVDCYNWNFVDPEREKSSTSSTRQTLTSSSTSVTETKTESTCVGRGWLGQCTKWDR